MQLVDNATATPASSAGSSPVPALDPTATIMEFINNVSPTIASLIPPVAVAPLATVANVKITPLLLLTVYAAWRILD